MNSAQHRQGGEGGGPRSRFLRGATGLRLHARCAGSGSLACVFLHGFGVPVQIWDDLLVSVEGFVAGVAVEFRGHGDSDWDPAQQYDIDTLSRDVIAVADALGLERFALIGHSLGGRVAMHITDRWAERVAALAIVDTGPELNPTGVRRVLESAASLPSDFSGVNEVRSWLQRTYPLAVDAAIELCTLHGFWRQPDGRLRPKLDPAFRRAIWPGARLTNGAKEQAPQDWWQVLRNVKVPAFVVRGQVSAVLESEIAERMAARTLAQGRLVEVPRAGHAVMLDNPEGCWMVLRQFIKEQALAVSWPETNPIVLVTSQNVPGATVLSQSEYEHE